ncbi:MAG TPA: anthranilate synthase component I [Solirubrobacteraceae bacterium]|jgi:anthranilate synthase component 1
MPVAAELPVADPAGELAIEPTLEHARELSMQSAPGEEPYNLLALRHSFIDDCETPVSAFLKLRALAPSEPAFLLESADHGQRVGRWSFIGVRPRSVLRWSLPDVVQAVGRSAPSGEGQAAQRESGEDPYALAAALVGRFRQAPISWSEADRPPPFTGGAVGFFGYDLVRTVEPLAEPNPDPLGLPDMALMLSDALVIFDHLKHTVTIIANADLDDEPDVERAYAAARETITQIRRQLAGPVPAVAKTPGSERRTMPDFQPNMERAQFEAMVERIVRYIYAGDAFQVVPSQRWSAPVPVDAFSIYRGLRTVNPSPYMYFLDFGDFQVAGASPEPLLTVIAGAPGRGARVSTRPIAGTRPRGADVSEDERIAHELLDDPKERAEHVMLVDLGRNDLGRVCEAGSVEVETFMAVETYSHVMHIVSSVAGTLREGVTPMDALRSVLPAGTLSGAPKVRAMQIIDELEPIKRGGYGGAIGYLSYGGELDTCIHIRTVVVKDGVAHIQAGGGTVADAKPAYEYEESRAKSRAVLRAIELAISQTDWP